MIAKRYRTETRFLAALRQAIKDHGSDRIVWYGTDHYWTLETPKVERVRT